MTQVVNYRINRIFNTHVSILSWHFRREALWIFHHYPLFYYFFATGDAFRIFKAIPKWENKPPKVTANKGIPGNFMMFLEHTSEKTSIATKHAGL